METINHRICEILNIFYLPKIIYLQKIGEYSPEDRTIAGYFNVPRSTISYTHRPLEYVTCEEYHHCLAQLAYVFVDSLILDGLEEFHLINFEKFKKLMIESRMRLREIKSWRFMKNVDKNTDFELILQLNEIKSYKQFLVLTISVNGVIKAKELKFIIPLNDVE